MANKKVHIYFVPGLAASPKIFEHIRIPEELAKVHYLEWFLPKSTNESLENYAARMASQIKEENPVLVGVSFGGIMVQEIAKHISTKKVIIVSSIKTSTELPKRLKFLRFTKIYILLSFLPFIKGKHLERFAFGSFAKKRVQLYKLYLSVRDPLYLKWAVQQIVCWKQKQEPKNIVHIQGTNDHIFPHKNITAFKPVNNGTHAMIIFKAKTISNIITAELKLLK